MVLDSLQNRVLFGKKKKRKNHVCNWSCTEYTWEDIKETEKENWVDEAGMGSRLFNV